MASSSATASWFHRTLTRRYRAAFSEPGFIRSVALGVPLLVVGWFANYYAIIFSSERASNSVTDIVLSNVPVFEVDGLFVYGTMIVAAITVAVALYHPKRIPFTLKAIALFWIIRSIFVTLTHIAPFESHIMTDFGPSINEMFFGADLFFSAHTGMPFLGALTFWREKGLRNFYILSSMYFAVIVLLGHLHYSIDVASAFFITYGIFHIALWLFPQDYKWLVRDEARSGA